MHHPCGIEYDLRSSLVRIEGDLRLPLRSRPERTAMRILVVEDDPLLAESLIRALQQQGDGFGHARRGQDAHAALCNPRFDRQQLDLGLPGVDGFEVLRRLRARSDPTPVLVVTAREAV